MVSILVKSYGIWQHEEILKTNPSLKQRYFTLKFFLITSRSFRGAHPLNFA